MPLRMQQLILLVSVFFILISSSAFAYDEQAWRDSKSEDINFMEFTFIGTSIKAYFFGNRKLMIDTYWETYGRTLPLNTFCRATAYYFGDDIIYEVWIAAKKINGLIYPHLDCFGHEIQHILHWKYPDRFGNPDDSLTKEDLKEMNL